MAWIRCKNCNKRISDKEEVCPKCGHKIKKKQKDFKYLKIIVKVLLLLFQVILTCFIFKISKVLLYTEKFSSLYILIGFIVLLLIVSIVNIKFITSKLKGFSCLIGLLIMILSFTVIINLSFKTIKAIRYDNSMEIYNLTEKFSLKDSKKIKNSIDEIFEYDDGISVRNVEIANFYLDDDQYNLYLNDFYNNYRLKFKVKLDNKKIKDIYWEYDDNKLYLFKDYKKTKDFSYYYAMNIVSKTLGENIEGLAKIEDDIYSKLKNKFNNSGNIMVNYDEFVYDKNNNRFKYNCSCQTMDYYGRMNDYKFTIYFDKVDNVKNKKIWYYGDSSFDFVDIVFKI